MHSQQAQIEVWQGHRTLLTSAFLGVPSPYLQMRSEESQRRSNHLRTGSLLGGYLKALTDRGADTIVLGCTHYPFLRPLIEELAPGLTLIETGQAVARQLMRKLCEKRMLNPSSTAGCCDFWSSASPSTAAALISALWGTTVSVRPLDP